MEIEKADVGVFDAGLGGLTVVGGLKRRNPNLRIVYFGDCANMPYSPRGKAWITARAQQIVDTLQPRCTHLVIGCNTMSTVADRLHAQNGLYDIISATRCILQRSSPIDQLILVGMAATIDSAAYEKDVTAAHIIRVPCRNLASLIEANGGISPLVERCIEEEIGGALNAPTGGDVAVVLACTHYPLVRQNIEDVIRDRLKPSTMSVFDPSAVLSDMLGSKLSATTSGFVRLYINNSDSSTIRVALQRFLLFTDLTADQVCLGDLQST